MPSSSTYRTFVTEQLGRVVSQVRSRSMFGGFGIYSGDLFFALIANDTLYFKVDDTNRADYEARGMGPFRPYGDDRESMNYYEVPAELLEDSSGLRDWADKAMAAARRKRAKR